MHYSFDVPVTPADTAGDPVIFPMPLATGILRNVKIFFDYGCGRTVRACLFNRGIQILPTNADGYYALDGDKAEANLYYNLDDDNELFLVAWNVEGSYDHTLSVHLEVQGPDEPSLETLQRLMIDTVNRLIDLIRAWL